MLNYLIFVITGQMHRESTLHIEYSIRLIIPLPIAAFFGPIRNDVPQQHVCTKLRWLPGW